MTMPSFMCINILVYQMGDYIFVLQSTLNDHAMSFIFLKIYHFTTVALVSEIQSHIVHIDDSEEQDSTKTIINDLTFIRSCTRSS
jgi:hypothetical protein